MGLPATYHRNQKMTNGNFDPKPDNYCQEHNSLASFKKSEILSRKETIKFEAFMRHCGENVRKRSACIGSTIQLE